MKLSLIRVDWVHANALKMVAGFVKKQRIPLQLENVSIR